MYMYIYIGMYLSHEVCGFSFNLGGSFLWVSLYTLVFGVDIKALIFGNSQTNMRILQTVFSGIPLLLDLRTGHVKSFRSCALSGPK